MTGIEKEEEMIRKAHEEAAAQENLENTGKSISKDEHVGAEERPNQESKLKLEHIEEEPEDSASTKNFQGHHYNYKPLERKMALMTDEEYITNRLDNQVDWYDRKSSLNQKRYKMLKKVEIIIAATIPVVTTMGALIPNETLETGMLVFAAVAGIILVVINKNLELEDYLRFWKEYRAACEALQYERALYLTRTEPYDEEDAFPRLVEKVESILSKETQKWQSRIKQTQAPDPTTKKADFPKSGIGPYAMK